MKEPHGKPYWGSHDLNLDWRCMYLMAEESTMASGLEYMIDATKKFKVIC